MQEQLRDKIEQLFEYRAFLSCTGLAEEVLPN